MEKFKLTFYGGVGSVSGANFLLEGAGKKILIDAGLYKGCYDCEKKNLKEFPYKPSDIDFIFLSQSHLEHSGRIPKLVKDGFKGVIYSTSETKFITELVYKDYLEKEGNNKKLFDGDDLKKTMSIWNVNYYGEEINLGGGLVASLFDAGHILGSAMINFNYNNKNLLFANSLGVSFLKDLSGINKLGDIDYLVLESVYGDKIHEVTSNRKETLENIIENTVNRQGNVLLPISFVDKIYTVLSEIQKLMERGRIPKIPVFIDSSMAMKTMSVYGNLFKCGEESCNDLEDLVKSFKELKFIKSKEDYEQVKEIGGSKIIIIGASHDKGSEKHIMDCIQNPNNTIVFVDYQPINSIGRSLQEGSGVLKTEEGEVSALSQIETIDGYSSHADHNRLFMFVDDLKKQLKKVFVVIGEPKASMFLSQKIRDYMGVDTKYPRNGESCELDF